MTSSNPIGRLSSIYALFRRAASSLQSPFLLVVRFYWGWQLTQEGLGKLHNIAHVTGYFASLHIPFPGANAHFIALLELFGGILLIAGLLSRLTAFLLACDMIVAYITADAAALHAVFSDPGKFYTADPYTFLFASLMILIFGPGRLALDYFLLRRPQLSPTVVAV